MHRDPNSPRPRRTVLATTGLTASASVIAAALLGGQLAEREPVSSGSAVALPFAETDAGTDSEQGGQPYGDRQAESGDEA